MLDHEGGRGKAGIVAALDVDRPPLIGSFWCPRGPRPSGSVRPRPPPPPPPPLAQVTPKGRGGGGQGEGKKPQERLWASAAGPAAPASAPPPVTRSSAPATDNAIKRTSARVPDRSRR